MEIGGTAGTMVNLLRLWMTIVLLVTITITITVTTGQQKPRPQQQRSEKSSSVTRVEFVNPDPVKEINLAMELKKDDDDDDDEDDPQTQVSLSQSLSESESLSLSLRKLQTQAQQTNNEIKGRFRVEYTLTGNGSANLPVGDILTNDMDTKNKLQPILDLLVDAYNTINVNDPQQRELIEPVTFVSGVILAPDQNNRSRNRSLSRRLQFGIARIIVDVVGRCNGCPVDAPLTNQVSDGGSRKKKQRELTPTNTEDHLRTLQLQQVSPRGGGGSNDEESKLRRKKQRKLQGKNGKGKGYNSNEGVLNPDEDRGATPVPLPIPTFTPPPSLSPTSPPPTLSPSTPPTSPPTLTPTTLTPTSPPTPPPTAFILASEERLRLEYSDIVMDLNNELIQDVSFLQEIEFACPASSSSSNNQGIPALTERIYYNCPRPLPSGFLVSNNNNDDDATGGGIWCLSTPSDSLGEFLHLQPCDFDKPHVNNNQGWSILDDTLHGGIAFQSTKYPDRCIGVGDYFDAPFLGDRLFVGACAVHTTFQFDFTQNYLKIPHLAGEEEPFCVTNEGITASNFDALNAQACPTQYETDDDDDFQWTFLFV